MIQFWRSVASCASSSAMPMSRRRTLRSSKALSFLHQRADGAQVEDFQGWNDGRTPWRVRNPSVQRRHRPGDCEMRKYIAPVESQACHLGVCVGRSTQTADTRASTGIRRLEFERFREGYSIAPVERRGRTVRTCLKRLGNLTRNTDGSRRRVTCRLALCISQTAQRTADRRRARA